MSLLFLQQTFSSQWTVGNVIELGVVALTASGYTVSRRQETRERKEGQAKAAKDREAALITQTKMHSENSERLQVLMKFHEYQQAVNLKRDEQVNQLTALAAGTAEMIRGLNRRLELMENRYSRGQE